MKAMIIIAICVAGIFAIDDIKEENIEFFFHAYIIVVLSLLLSVV